MIQPPPIEDFSDADILTHLIGEADPKPGQAAPRVGDAVELRADKRGLELEAWTPSGHRLGRVPPPDRDVIAALLPASALRGRITALVPRPLLAGAGRIHIRVTVE